MRASSTLDMASAIDAASSVAVKAKKVVIKNVRIFDGSRITEPRAVVVENGLIACDPNGAEEIDAENNILIPGLIDCHVHLQTDADLHAMASWGVTTGLGMAEWPPSKHRALRNKVGLTDIRSPGMPATSPGSIHSKLLSMPPEKLVTGPGDAEAFITERLKEEADYIKIIADVPGPDQETLNAITAAAHKEGKIVIAHASAYTPFSMAQDANVDVITHAPRDKVLDSEAVHRMAESKRISVPTLTMMEGVSRPPSWSAIFRLLFQPLMFLTIVSHMRRQPPQNYENSRDSVTALYKAGVPILAGTDANSEPSSPFQVRHGEALHRELELLLEAGMSTVEVLRSATSLPAKFFGLGDRGAIEDGKRADLVLLSEDPLKDIKATRSIRRVWCGGVEYIME